MLKDHASAALATEFGGNWLDFRRFEEHNSVDRERFPSFDDELRQAMFEEPVRFFLDVSARPPGARFPLRQATRSSIPSLAKHYGMPVPGQGPTTGCGSTTPTSTAAAGCCRWRCS